MYGEWRGGRAYFKLTSEDSSQTDFCQWAGSKGVVLQFYCRFRSTSLHKPDHKETNRSPQFEEKRYCTCCANQSTSFMASLESGNHSLSIKADSGSEDRPYIYGNDRCWRR